MLNVKSAYSGYGSMFRLPWPRAHKAVFRSSVVVIADTPQCALNQRFDIQAVMNGSNGYRIRWKTD